MSKIPFNKPYMTGRELHYISQAHAKGHMAANGEFTRACEQWLENYCRSARAILTHSCTGALEMSALLADIRPGDEVIMPSFTFVSTANAFLLRGAVPVFVDIREDTLNIDESLIEAAISSRTKAIVLVHYAGVACAMDAITDIARKHDIVMVEDNAHGLGSKYKGQPLGSFAQLSALSFHETKNVISGEGGALLINDEKYSERAEIVRDKGTNRSRFLRGQVDKYTWVDLGSSFPPSDIIAAFLFAQLEAADDINRQRLGIWSSYNDAFSECEGQGLLRRPHVPEYCEHNAHMYYLLLPNLAARTGLIRRLEERNIQAVFHYVPLHNSPIGAKVGRVAGELPVTERVADCLVRLPFWIGIEPHIDEITDGVIASVREEA